MVASKLANMPRGGNGNNQYSKSANLQNSELTQNKLDSKDENKSANLQNSFVSQTEAAKLLNVSPIYNSIDLHAIE